MTKKIESVELDELDAVEAIHKSKAIVVNGRTYDVLNLTHYKRLKIFSYFTTVKDEIAAGTYGFLDTDKFKEIDNLIQSNLTFDKVLLSKRTGHFEEFASDYIELIFTTLLVFSYPLLRGDRTG